MEDVSGETALLCRLVDGSSGETPARRTMSEAELHLIRACLDGGLHNKAKRGELEQSLPVGFDRDDDGRIVPSAAGAVVLSACPNTFPAMSAGTSTWPPANVCRQT
jgi:hypothetical protein